HKQCKIKKVTEIFYYLSTWCFMQLRSFQFIMKNFFELFYFWSNNKPAIRLATVLIEIILVIIFCGIKISVRFDCSNDRIIESTTFIQFCFIMFGLIFLGWICIKYY